MFSFYNTPAVPGSPSGDPYTVLNAVFSWILVQALVAIYSYIPVYYLVILPIVLWFLLLSIFVGQIFSRFYVCWRWYKCMAALSRLKMGFAEGFRPQSEKDFRRASFDRRQKASTITQAKNKHGPRHSKDRFKPMKMVQKPLPTSSKKYKPNSLGEEDELFDRVRSSLETLSLASGTDMSDYYLTKIENLIAYFLTIKDCSTVSSFIAATFLYFKTNYSSSVCKRAMDLVKGVIDDDGYEPQAVGAKPLWLVNLRQAHTNWERVKSNPGFEKVSKILSLCVAMGLCEASSLEIGSKGFKLFALQAIPKHADAFSLADAVFDTVVFFIESGYNCFATGTLTPLLYGVDVLGEYTEDFAKCMRCQEYALCGNLEKLEGMDENDYEALLDKTIEASNLYAKTSKNVMEKTFFTKKAELLRSWQAAFRQTRVSGGLREAPYCIGVFGGTCVGKSSLSNILMVCTLLCNGYNAEDSRIVTLNEADKHMSNYRSYVNGVVIDDIGNTKPEYSERSPTSLIIQLNNNIRSYAQMAELAMKGKVSIEPRVVIGTKNVKDSCATVYSNEPASIARRDRITLTVTVKPKFATHDMLDEAKVRECYGDNVPTIPDLWDLKVERAYPIPSKVKGKPASIGWEVVKWGGRPLQKISIAELLRWIRQDSEKYYKNQRLFVEKSNGLASKLVLCEKCKLPTPEVCACEGEHVATFAKTFEDCSDGYCTRCELHHPSSKEYKQQSLTYAVILPILGQFRRNFFEWWDFTFNYWDRETSVQIVKKLKFYESSKWMMWTSYVPIGWLQNSYVERYLHLFYIKRLRKSVIRFRLIICAITIMLFRLVLFYPLVVLPLSIWLPVALILFAWAVSIEKRRLYRRIICCNKAMPAVFKEYRDNQIKFILGLGSFLLVIYGISVVWRNMHPKTDAKAKKEDESDDDEKEESGEAEEKDPQGSLTPKSLDDIKARDKEENPWAGVQTASYPTSHITRTTSMDQLEKLCFDNLCHMVLEYDEKGWVWNTPMVRRCNAFFIGSNVCIVPTHTLAHKRYKAHFIRHNPSNIGGNFSCYIDADYAVPLEGTDCTLVWVPNGGDWKDLTKYFPTIYHPTCPARLTYKNSDGESIKSKLLAQLCKVKTYMEFVGYEYKLDFNTFDGLCMAPIISETKSPHIIGFHLGGKDNTPEGCAGAVLQEELLSATKKIRNISKSCIPGKNTGTLNKELYGIPYHISDDVHPKSPVNYLPVGSNCRYHGQIKGRATYKSKVQSSCISDVVNAVCKVPQRWGAPKFNEGYPWQKSLAHSTNPSIGMEPHLLEKATDDYLSHLLKVLKEGDEFRKTVRKLTEMEVVCGMDGVRFIDKMPPNTSVGFLPGGPKSRYLTALDPLEYPTHQNPMQLDARFWSRAAEIKAAYLRGERAYPLFKACLKDEPTPLEKDKVRVFQGAPIAFQILVRQYYLPIARFLSMYPLDSECAVGVNAQGPEWNQLSDFIRQYGSDRILAGDYSKYDLRMSAQLMFAAFRIMIEVAKECGYTSEDVTVMEGIATDICYPMMAYNGDLIQHFGSNPSGHNLTVYINSIVNSLLFRCAYYHIVKPSKQKPFREICALITYGDDAKSSVHKDYPEFNHISVAKFLAERDMIFTMPDKQSKPTKYMSDSDADLLKRKNIWNAELGVYLGALDEDSIFKSLHANLKSSVLTDEQVSMQCIDGALREWFPHGREIYESRRAEMIEIAKRANIAHGCRELGMTYDDRIADWRKKYL